MRRIIVLLLVLVLLVPSFPRVGEGANFAKNIDVIFGDFKLNVNGNKIASHKEPFLYDENLFVSVNDLAKGLELDIKVSGSGIWFNSNGKLNVDSYGSKLPVVFQRGYELLAKERLIKALEDEIKALEGKETERLDSKFNPTWRNIRVGFGGINVYVDNNKIDLYVAPLKYNNEYYVDLDSIAPYFFMTPELGKDQSTINIDSNGVLATSSSSGIQYLLSLREGRNYLLDLQRAELENRKHIIKDLKLSFEKIKNLKALEKYLNTYFNKVMDLEVSIELLEQSNWIYMDISFPASRNANWSKLKRTDVESWIWNIYTAIVNLYNKDALITGNIRSPYHSVSSTSKYKNYVVFQSRENDIYFDFTNSRLAKEEITNLDHLVEMLKDSFNKYGNFTIDYKSQLSGDNVELSVYLSTDELSKSNLFTKMGFLRLLSQRIRNIYPDLDVYGQIIYPGDIKPFDFYIWENKVRSKDLMNETMEYINNGFGYFFTGNFGYRLKYGLYELDLDNFRLMVEGDFSVEDEYWIKGGDLALDSLHTTVHHALSTIVSLWDANLTVDILDKNGVYISDFDLHQGEVAMVTASPSGGDVPYGDKVYLYTATPGARIYYTVDGSTPTSLSTFYSNGIPITKDTVINAIGYMDGLNPSRVSTFKYTSVEKGNVSEGLTNLVVSHGVLNPGFSQNVLDYTVSVDSGLSSILITPYARLGMIWVNEDMIGTGKFKEIPLKNATTTISIKVKETDTTEKVYRVVVTKDKGESKFKWGELKFSTSLNILVFKGKIVNDEIQDFSSYKIRLLTKTNKPIETVSLSKQGEFAFPNKKLDVLETLFGFKYELIDGSGNTVWSDEVK